MSEDKFIPISDPKEAVKALNQITEMYNERGLVIKSLQQRIKELEEKLNNEWKPASEAVVGVEYDVCGGECLHYSEYSDYDEWSPMKSDVAVATREDDTLLESSFTGAYADEHGARWYYRPKWIKERPISHTQEGDKKECIK